MEFENDPSMCAEIAAVDMRWIREHYPDLVRRRPADELLDLDQVADTHGVLAARRAARGPSKSIDDRG